MLQSWLEEQRWRGRAYQPQFQRSQVSVTWLGALLAITLAVGLTVLLGQQFRCLHPPAGGLAFLGVALGATPPFVLIAALPYPHHWL